MSALAWYLPIGLVVLILLVFVDVWVTITHDDTIEARYERRLDQLKAEMETSWVARWKQYFLSLGFFLKLVSSWLFWPVTTVHWFLVFRSGQTLMGRALWDHDQEMAQKAQKDLEQSRKATADVAKQILKAVDDAEKGRKAEDRPSLIAEAEQARKHKP